MTPAHCVPAARRYAVRGRYPSFELAQRRVEFLRQYWGVWPGITSAGGDGLYGLAFDPAGGGDGVPGRGWGTGGTPPGRDEAKSGACQVAETAEGPGGAGPNGVMGG